MPLDVLRAMRVGPGGFRLVLPGRTPTKGNHGVQVRPGLHLPSKPYRKWVRDTSIAALVLWSRVRDLRFNLPIMHHVRVTVAIYLPTRQRGDFDNYQKAIGDWLQLNQFIADDRLIHWRSVGVFLDKYDPRMELLIEPYELNPGEIR